MFRLYYLHEKNMTVFRIFPNSAHRSRLLYRFSSPSRFISSFSARSAGFSGRLPSFCIGTKPFANRGFLYGPWLPVYGIGAVLFYLLLGCRRKKKKKKSTRPASFFLSAGIGTGLELLIGWFLDTFWDLRYWDYSGYPLHFHGYICLYAAVGFGIAGVLWICVLEAPLTRLWKRLSPKVRLGLNTLLLLLFAADCAAALIFPNRGAGITFP